MTEIDRLAKDLWQYLVATQPYYALRTGREVERLRAETLEDAEADCAFARRLRERLAPLLDRPCPDPERVTAEFLDDVCRRFEEAPDCWWTAFPHTPYNAYRISFYGQLVLSAHRFAAPGDVDRYLSLVADFARFIRAQTARLDAQATRGWRIPKPALPGVRATLEGFARAAPAWTSVAVARVKALGDRDRRRLAEAADGLLCKHVVPALEAARAAVGPEYAGLAPDAVGLAQYPGGEAAYALWTRRHMTYELSAPEVNAVGVHEVARLTDAMAALRAQLGFRGDEAAFASAMRDKGRLYASSPQDVESRYRRCMDRIRPLVTNYFRSQPRAPYDVRRLDVAAEAGMTYGYYEAPTASQPMGLYRYNGSGLETRLQVNAAALIYHELVPGHHFHLARQAENEELPNVRRQSVDLSVFNEGWAEYASGLAGEMGLYDDPDDAYGRLLHERFTAQRLVVDTGLNALGWSLEQGRAYMARYTLESPMQVASETLRYSTDLPGQALAYRIGYLKFRDLRQKMRSALGARFDVRDFHEAVLAEGALPLPVLERHVDRAIARLAVLDGGWR